MDPTAYGGARADTDTPGRTNVRADAGRAWHARARVRAGRMLDGQGLWWGMRLSSVRRLRHERATTKKVFYSILVVDVTILCDPLKKRR